MRKTAYIWAALLAVICLANCSDYETYGDKKKKERTAIDQFIIDQNIKVISETVFAQQDYTTNVSSNEYVYHTKSGVYMQIVRKGEGSPLESGKTVDVIARFSEYNILTGDTTLNDLYNGRIYDKLSVTRTGSTVTASFTSGMMYSAYSSALVPSGWLVPLLYINLGREGDGDEAVALVRLIVPHSQGHTYASQQVNPYFYEIKFSKGQ